MIGWIKLHRKLLDNPIFDNPNLLRVWMWCLLKASHDNYKQMVGLQVIDLEPGQFVTGRFKGSDELKINPSTFYKYLKTLERLQMIRLSSNNKMTIVSIENWERYQTKDSQEYQQNNNKITTKEQQNNTNKNGKNIKNIYSAFFEEVWKMYPNKKGKGQVSDTKKKEIHKLGDEFKRCIERYIKDVECRRNSGFQELKFQNGSTFFNSGYVDYLDDNYEDKPITSDPYEGLEVY